MLWIIYNLLFPIVFLFMLPKFITRMLKRGGYGSHFEQRIGHFGTKTKDRLREHRRIWVHAVSVGEIFVALKFIKAYRKAHPDTYFALSTTTSTGHTIAKQEMDHRDVLFYFPVDLPIIIRKVLRVLNPLRIVLVEGEFWPNLIRLAGNQDIPISLINGRMSERSYKGYRKLRSLTQDVLRRIDPICVQGEVDAERLIAIGAPMENIHIMGTVKFDVAERDERGEETARAIIEKLHVSEDAVILLGGSTWPGEEDVMCDVYNTFKDSCPDLFLVIVPRHVERADEVVQSLEKHSLSFVRRSEIDDSAPDTRPDALFVDTTGELRNFYSVADIIFVGKSLKEHGGQNPIEPAMYGKAVLVGPNMENFPQVMAEFRKQQAIEQVDDEDTLTSTVDTLLVQPEMREQLGIRAAAVVEENRGVMRRTVELLGTHRRG
jgi:3-deoxy-D-manno-octulosonic-acid transferase